MSPVLPPMNGSKARMASTAQIHHARTNARRGVSAATPLAVVVVAMVYTRFTVTWPKRPLGFNVRTVMTMTSATVSFSPLPTM